MHTFLIKPTNRCNLRCKYCFIDSDIKSSSNLMSIELAKLIIDKVASFVYSKGFKSCKILWHGGEPLYWSANNYEEVLAYMFNQYPYINWRNSIQTNLTRLSNKHLDTFRKYDMKLSTSLDGYKDINDSVRVCANGKGSFDFVVEKLHNLSLNKIRSGMIVILSSVNFEKIIEIYNFFRSHNQSFRINPLINAGDALKDKLSITPMQYANAMTNLFDYWITDKKAVPVANFIDWISTLVTRKTSSCTFVDNCQESFTVFEPNGDISVCDRLCGVSEFIIGNIIKDSLPHIIQKKKHIFIHRATKLLASSCRDCDYWDICYGGCPAEAYFQYHNVNYKFGNCMALKYIYNHIKAQYLDGNLEKLTSSIPIDPLNNPYMFLRIAIKDKQHFKTN